MSAFDLSQTAERDLEEILRYIARDKPSAATRFRQRLFDRMQLLAQHPLLGQTRDDLLLGLRCHSVGDYVIYYEIGEESIRISRVVHGARDIAALYHPDP